MCSHDPVFHMNMEFPYFMYKRRKCKSIFCENVFSIAMEFSVEKTSKDIALNDKSCFSYFSLDCFLQFKGQLQKQSCTCET